MEQDKVLEQAKVLFVDDEENILRSLKRLFMEEEFEVLTATSGDEGLKILQGDSSIGLIVSDQRMPGMNGAEFLEKAKKVAPMSIRMILTGYADVQAAVDAINKGGAFRYIAKPWQDEDLVQTVKEALNRYSLILENRKLNKIVKKQQQELKKWSQELEIIVQEQTMELQTNYDNLRKLHTRLENNFENTIQAFSGLIELRDKSMRNHAKNVAELAVKIAEAMGLHDREREIIRVAALLHDIGKIGIPDVLLGVSFEDMAAEHRVEYMRHPIRGQAAIDIIEDLREIGLLIRHHHERFDGKGFPDKLKNIDIPRGARIIALTDFIDIHIRRHPGDTGIAPTLKKVKAERSKMFDPEIVVFADKATEEIYRKRQFDDDFFEKELSPKDLRNDMVLSRDVISGTGLLLLRKGTTLNDTNMTILRRYYDLDPAKKGVFVMVTR